MTDAHRCLAGNACRAAEIHAGKWLGAPTTEANTLCPVCRKSIESAVRQLPKDWADLRAALGERSPNVGTKIRSTPTPAMPISARKEALMVSIVETVDRAAGIVAELLHTDQPSARRSTPKDAEGHDPEDGSVVAAAAEAVVPEAGQRLTAWIAMVQPNIDLLATAPVDTHNVWAKPRRCDTHYDAIRFAESFIELAKPNTKEAEEAQNQLRRAYAAAGACDECNGWSDRGQARELIELSGIDIALQLTELHNQTRAELGLTRLRHRYEMPCPNCGADVGREDGTTIIDCKNCESSWTEREYKFLVGLITHERLDMEILKYLLQEGYVRLDQIQEVIDKLDQDPAIDEPGAGRIILDHLKAIIDGHKRPADRVIATDRKTAQERQTSDDNWAWGNNETAYKPPKPKPKPERAPVKNPIHPSSLTTVVDIDVEAAQSGRTACPECNMIHAGECA